MSEKNLIEALLRGKPYFGSAMCALQGPAIRHQYLGALVDVVGRSKRWRKIRILEVGSWAGASAVSWAKAIKKLGRRGRVTCVDLWQPYFDLTIHHEAHYREMSEATIEKKIFQLFLHNIRAAQVSDMVDYVVGNAREILSRLPSEKFDIVYIDGSHAYEDVRSDIRDAKRLVRERGIICGDDLELRRNDVDEQEHIAAIEQQKDYVYSQKAHENYHPGVTEAVAREFGDVSCWEGIWAMQKIGGGWEKTDLDMKKVEIPQHILDALGSTEIERVDETRDFNLVRTGHRFFAVAKTLGPTELFVERLGERELPPIIFVGDTLEQPREKAIQFERENSFPEPELMEEFRGYNLVKVGDNFIAVVKKLGPLNLFRERLGERELPPLVLIATDLAGLRSRILDTVDDSSLEHGVDP
jgi:predicted O-methyltransferase YrrM